MQKTNTTFTFTDNYFINDLPPTHNPLIAHQSMDTLSNVRDTLCVLRELTEANEFSLNDNSTAGLHFLMTCIIRAVEFEVEHRSHKTF